MSTISNPRVIARLERGDSRLGASCMEGEVKQPNARVTHQHVAAGSLSSCSSHFMAALFPQHKLTVIRQLNGVYKMNISSLSLQRRLKLASLLLLSLPAVVAAACFAHGHGALGSLVLTCVLSAAFALGSLGAYALLSIKRLSTGSSETHGHIAAALGAARTAATSTTHS